MDTAFFHGKATRAKIRRRQSCWCSPPFFGLICQTLVGDGQIKSCFPVRLVDIHETHGNAKKNIIGILLAAVAAAICVAIDELLKEEKE